MLGKNLDLEFDTTYTTADGTAKRLVSCEELGVFLPLMRTKGEMKFSGNSLEIDFMQVKVLISTNIPWRLQA